MSSTSHQTKCRNQKAPHAPRGAIGELGLCVSSSGQHWTPNTHALRHTGPARKEQCRNRRVLRMSRAIHQTKCRNRKALHAPKGNRRTGILCVFFGAERLQKCTCRRRPSRMPPHHERHMFCRLRHQQNRMPKKATAQRQQQCNPPDEVSEP